MKGRLIDQSSTLCRKLAACVVVISLASLCMAQDGLVISTCDDASVWRGGESEAETVREGTGAVRWVPSKQAGLSSNAIPHDWTAGNCLSFWLHSAKATGSRVWIIVESQDPTQDGMDYFSQSLVVDWRGWNRVLLPFSVMARVRHPIGWHNIDILQLHSAWDKGAGASAEDMWILDDVRVITISDTGQRMTDEEFFEAMDLTRPGLERVREAVQAGDIAAAKERFREYFLARRDVRWFSNWWERPEPPEKRPNTGRADETLAHIYNFDGKRYELGEDIDWASNQRNEGEAATIEWNASLNRHFFFDYLADAYVGTLEEKYATEIRDMMLDWIDDSPVLLSGSGNGPYHYAWETLNTAVRAGDTWIDALWRTADAPCWDANSLTTVIKSLVEHARHLLKWPSKANWLTAESKALTIVGTLLPEMKEADNWRETGIERLYTQMAEEIYPDGLENELALGYNLWVLRNYSDIYDLMLANDRTGEVPADFRDLLERMYNYLLYATGPDWRVPGLNDSGHAGPDAALQKGFTYFPHRTDFQWVLTRGAQGDRPAETSYAFPYSGHYVMRSDWTRDARFLFLDAGPFGSGHQHEDKLGFTMQAHGRWWIVEGGSYMYDKSRWRRYVLSTRAHNTARVDGEDQNSRRDRSTYVLKPPFEPLDNPWVSNDSLDYVSGVYDTGYGKDGQIRVTHRREVLFVKPDYWVIVDTFTPQDDAVHEYETIFHINAETAQTQGSSVSAVADGRRLDLIGSGPDLAVDVVKGIAEEPVQGWANYPWRAVPTALFRNTAAGSVRNVYVLAPSPSEQPDVSVETVKSDPAGECLRVTRADGSADVIALSATEGGGEQSLGPVITDGRVAVVSLDARGVPGQVGIIGGSRVRYEP